MTDSTAATPVQPFRMGKIAVVGRPNVGKSTLLNQIVGERVSIVSPKPQTTRDRIAGILTRPDAQLVFLDTPGLNPGDKLDALQRYMTAQARGALEEADLLLHLVKMPERSPVPFTPRLHPSDASLLDELAALRKPVWAVVNRTDVLKRHVVIPMLTLLAEERRYTELFAVSARTGDGVNRLVEALVAAMPAGEPMYPADEYTDRPVRFLAAELIREQVFRLTHQELPYATGVTIDAWTEKPTVAHIHASIVVERPGQKAIVIGKGGAMLKEIGTAARTAIEQMTGRPAFLELFVKVEAEWTKTRRGLNEAGYSGG